MLRKIESNTMQRICQRCFKKYLINDIQSYWNRSYIFSGYTNHYQTTKMEHVLRKCIQNNIMWCDVCMYTPLFSIHNSAYCKRVYNYHKENRSGTVSEHSRFNLIKPDNVRQCLREMNTARYINH